MQYKGRTIYLPLDCYRLERYIHSNQRSKGFRMISATFFSTAIALNKNARKAPALPVMRTEPLSAFAGNCVTLLEKLHACVDFLLGDAKILERIAMAAVTILTFTDR